MIGARTKPPPRVTPPSRQHLQPLPRGKGPPPPAVSKLMGGGGGGAGASEEPPPSRIPAAFHVYSGKQRIFPSERPAGDVEVLHLANALGAMLEQWRAKLEASKPSFPMGSNGSTLWGVVQMIVYDIWSTIEESRIWDTALLEAQRQVHSYSPQLAAMLGRVRARLAQSFESILSMSQRLQYELQRWHTQWVHAGESLKQESSLRHGLQRQTEQLQAKVVQLENDGRIASVLATKVADGSQGYEQTLRQLQAEVQALRKQLRAQQAQTTALRGREVELRLTNEGLMEEVSRWQQQTQQATAEAQAQQMRQTFEAMGEAQQAELLGALQDIHTAAHPAAAARAPAPVSAPSEAAGSSVAEERLEVLRQLADSLSADEVLALRKQLDQRP
eukprot:Transcript_31617.p1 GENE.Transcript_31617~~Transcript_31617.p1  ORF type:complete len:388 (+),score=171.30 Transcript_31617:1145-2308(+)